MTTADDERGDLSVTLEWPDDPLDDAPVIAGGDPIARLEARLSDLEERERPGNEGMSRLVGAALDELSTRVDYVATELVEALRGMNETIRQLGDAVRTLDERVSTAAAAMEAPREKPASRAAKAAAIDEKTMDELVTRVSDEVEIRVAAAIKPKPPARKRG